MPHLFEIIQCSFTPISPFHLHRSIPLAYKKRTACSGFSGRHIPESVVGMLRNRWTASSGFSGRHRPDYAGSRFEALHQWYENAKAGTLPAQWNLDDYPLWPAEYGGLTWALGSGAVQHCAPRLGNIDREERHLQRIRDIIESSGLRWTETSKSGLLYQILRRKAPCFSNVDTPQVQGASLT